MGKEDWSVLEPASSCDRQTEASEIRSYDKGTFKGY